MSSFSINLMEHQILTCMILITLLLPRIIVEINSQIPLPSECTLPIENTNQYVECRYQIKFNATVLFSRCILRENNRNETNDISPTESNTSNSCSKRFTVFRDCDTHHYTPIYIIAIVCGSLLFLLLAAFGFICMFYVVPRQNQAIVLDSRGKKLDRASSETAANSSDANSTLNSDCLEPDLLPAKREKKFIIRRQVPIPSPNAKKSYEKGAQETLKKEANFTLPKFSLKLSNLKKPIEYNRDINKKRKRKKSGFKSHNLPEFVGQKLKKAKSIDTIKTEAGQQNLHIDSASESHPKNMDMKTVRESETRNLTTFATKSNNKTNSKMQPKLSAQKDGVEKLLVANKEDTIKSTQQKHTQSKSTVIQATNKKSEDDTHEGMSLALRTIND